MTRFADCKGNNEKVRQSCPGTQSLTTSSKRSTSNVRARIVQIRSPRRRPSRHIVHPDGSSEEQATLFREVLTALEERHLPYAVSGAFALRAHTGICRFTKDLDLFMTAKNIRRGLPFSARTWLRLRRGRSRMAGQGSQRRFFRGPDHRHEQRRDCGGRFLDRSGPVRLLCMGLRLVYWVRRELVASKIFVAKRERFDGADIAHVIYGTYGAFDWERELKLVGEHWEMLLWSLLLFRYVYPAQTHYVPAAIWRKLLRGFETQIANPCLTPGSGEVWWMRICLRSTSMNGNWRTFSKKRVRNVSPKSMLFQSIAAPCIGTSLLNGIA